MARICFMPRYNWELKLHQAAVSVNCWLAAVTLVFYTGVDRTNDKQGFLLWMRRAISDCQGFGAAAGWLKELIWM